jgi:hypothetical protein
MVAEAEDGAPTQARVEAGRWFLQKAFRDMSCKIRRKPSRPASKRPTEVLFR